VFENEIVCYNFGNAIADAKVRGQAPALKKVRVPELPARFDVDCEVGECVLYSAREHA